MEPLSDELWDLVSEMLDLAVDCFVAGESNPMVKIVDEAGKKQFFDVKDASGDVSPALIHMARNLISRGYATTAQMYVIVSDSYLTWEGARTDAVLAEAGQRGQSEGMIFAQRYRRDPDTGGPQLIGGPMILQAADMLLRQA